MRLFWNLILNFMFHSGHSFEGHRRLYLMGRSFQTKVGNVRGRKSSSHSTATTAHTAFAKVQASRNNDLFNVAPMMEYTDRHLRYMLRLLSKRSKLWTEMVTASTLVHNEGNLERWLAYNDHHEHPLVLQLGGSDANDLAVAVRRALPYGYDEINLNCGCPSDKVAGKGSFGAALMRDPDHVAALCSAMLDASGGEIPVSVKCRVGVLDQKDMAADRSLLDRPDEDYATLAHFVETVADKGGVRHFTVHARKAVLGGLSPDENRKVPPLNYGHVRQLVQDFPHLRFALNGGLETVEDCLKELHAAPGLAGVMLGRAVVARPWHLMSRVDEDIYGVSRASDCDLGLHQVGACTDAGGALHGARSVREGTETPLTRRRVLAEYGAYADEQMEIATVENPEYAPKLRRHLLRHVANLFAGEPNGKRFRNAIEQQLMVDHRKSPRKAKRGGGGGGGIGGGGEATMCTGDLDYVSAMRSPSTIIEAAAEVLLAETLDETPPRSPFEVTSASRGTAVLR